ncbi:uncharacterized protein LOC142168907 [Nicotiana tabacum]|uniref:Uncharacterized protein LOC142168907 n=1 Tax=Nicotiana tabacum TaxID=4097 RepID=A0AC58SMI0_TOBAC
MDDLSGIRKDNVAGTENVETSDDVELPEGYKPPKFEIFVGSGDPKVHLRTYCDKLVEVGMKGHTIEECRTLKDQIQMLIDTKVIQVLEGEPNVRNNPLPDHRGQGVNVIETDEEWDQEGSTTLIREGDTPKISPVTLMPVVVQTQMPFELEVATPFTPKGLSHNKALHITMQFEDKFIARVLIDRASSLNICPLTTLKRLGKGLHEIRMGSINVKAFDGSDKATIGKINLDLQMGPTWFDVEFQVLDISTSYNLLLGRLWIHEAGVVASTIHQAVKFEWNYQEVIIYGDRSNPIYTN